MNRLSKKMALTVLLGVMCLLLFGGVAEASSYTVKAGDSLFLIANRFGTSISAIQSLNQLSGSEIYPGQTLVISGTKSGGTSSGTRYTVQNGNTLSLIAQKFGTTVDALRKANNLWKDFLYPGQVLNIPTNASRNAQVASRSFSRSEIDLLARVVYAEARGEVYEGQVAVAAVVLNRLKNPEFGNSIASIIYQPGAFSCVDDGQIKLVPDQTAYKAVRDAMEGWDPTKGAIYYWNPNTAQSKWIWSRPITTQIGNHVFAK